MKNIAFDGSTQPATLRTGSSVYNPVKDWLTAPLWPKNYEVNDLVSLTIPDQTMSIRELLVRYAHGMPLGGFIEGDYANDQDNDDDLDEMPDFRTLDLSEREDIRAAYLDELNSIRKRIKEQNAKAKTPAAIEPIPPAGDTPPTD